MAVTVVAKEAVGAVKAVAGLLGGNKDKAKYENGTTDFEVNNRINDWTWPLWATEDSSFDYNYKRWLGWRKFPAKDHTWKRNEVITPARQAYAKNLLDMNTFDLYGCLKGQTTVAKELERMGTSERSAGEAQAITANMMTTLKQPSMLVMIGVVVIGAAILIFTGKKRG
jgi:hypothetical protein